MCTAVPYNQLSDVNLFFLVSVSSNYMRHYMTNYILCLSKIQTVKNYVWCKMNVANCHNRKHKAKCFCGKNFLQKNISNLFLKSCRCIRRIKYRVFLFGHGCNKKMESQEKLGKFHISSFLFFFRINIIWLSKHL